MALYVNESYINRTEGYRFYDTDEPIETDYDTPGEVYRFAVKEYGRCTGKVYIDGPNGDPLHVGWVFVKRVRYDDSNETYLREVWITLHDGPRPPRPHAPYHVIT